MEWMDDLDPSEDVTQAWLEKELANTREKLDQRVKRLEAPDSQEENEDEKELHKSPVSRLKELNDTVEALELSKEIAEWSKACDHGVSDDIFLDAQDCWDLANILVRHEKSSLHQNLFEREYQPLYNYVRANLILQLRGTLLQAGYPSAEACGRLMQESTISSSTLAQCCDWLTRLQVVNHHLTNHTLGRSSSSPWSSGDPYDVLVEFFRPIVERVRFHFVEYNTDRVTSTKIDRLPEWLLKYLQGHVLEGKPTNPKYSGPVSSPWELISLGLGGCVSEEMPLLFLNELVGLVQYVLGTERNFFRDHKIAGPESEAMLLCNAIEQLLEFDDALRNLLPMGQADRLLRLMDVFVAGDEELLSWWLAREKEQIFATLFDNKTKEEETNSKGKSDILSTMVKTRISPRAELFCALIRSVQIKASVFSFSGPYLNAVAVPLCMQFLDAVHDSATDLRKALASPQMQSEDALIQNLEDWMAVINGTRLAAAILTRENPWAQKSMAPSANSSVNDLARFGRSLEQLQNVFIEEFATTFVETYLMERMRLARYLMRCSHFLSHNVGDEEEDEDYDPDISFDLKPCLLAVHKFIALCSDGDANDGDENEAQTFAAAFAPKVMKAKVIPLLVEKFLEVALDLHGLTPEIVPEGASVFHRDIIALFGGLGPTESGAFSKKLRRLKDITKLMNMPARPLQTLQSALLGLVGGPEDPSRPRFIHSHQFTADATLFEQAECMLRAKGYSVELDDALSVLNRRRDLTRPQWS